ncbi:hypothetical protein [Streptomyces globisporus]
MTSTEAAAIALQDNAALWSAGEISASEVVDAAQEAVVRALARRMLAGDLEPRELTFRIHQRYGHELPLTERLAELDDEYDILEYGDRTVDQVDAEVTAEARRLAARPRVPAEPQGVPGVGDEWNSQSR